jgi:hypothetical protein
VVASALIDVLQLEQPFQSPRNRGASYFNVNFNLAEVLPDGLVKHPKLDPAVQRTHPDS